MPAQQKVPNAIQKALEIRRNSLPRTSENTSEPNLSETAAKQGGHPITRRITIIIFMGYRVDEGLRRHGSFHRFTQHW
jgi:hypothetical protein